MGKGDIVYLVNIFKGDCCIGNQISTVLGNEISTFNPFITDYNCPLGMEDPYQYACTQRISYIIVWVPSIGNDCVIREILWGKNILLKVCGM